jgi:hypothetical protein
MQLSLKRVNGLFKEFFTESYDFFKRKYLRQRALEKFQTMGDSPEYIMRCMPSLFVLSTGRCGTLYLTSLLNKIKEFDVHHEATPKLSVAAKYMYEHEVDLKGGVAAFLAARHHLIQDAFLFDQIYIETNNRLTFFAPYIEHVMPKARFLHLIRHPGDFVRSGMRRGYYDYDSRTESNPSVGMRKIKPENGEAAIEEWDALTRIGKISWLWYQTNQFIEDFKEEHPEKVMTLKSEYLFSDPNNAVSDVLGFMNLCLEESLVVESHVKNKQTAGSFPRYENWSQENKNSMKAIVGDLATKYGYRL